MADLRELYQEVILDHSKSPRNYRKIDPADRTADGTNPLCGDRVSLYVKLDGGRIADVAFQGQGCAISKSSASMMTDALKGKTEAEARALFEEFHEMVTGHGKPDAKALGKLTVFAGVSEFPARVKCASLAWHTLKAALDRSDKVTME
ncbi:MAG: SUF system NifU family Fe-S cluster assembly protein [Armatimonadetes bacterium 13_1_40CM_3_65_7]|nr:MAG: SUF system NifU family Fe-S cluster assembly protein [Armatimonadetes bacterium 13_1_40CM_3_65_7]